MEPCKMERNNLPRAKAAIQINEKGLQLLQQSKWNDAIDTFHEALTVLMDDTVGSPCYTDSSSWDEKAQRDMKQQGEANETNVVFPATTNKVAEIHNEIFTIFDRGLDVRTELLEFPCSLSPEHYESLIIAVCFYNAGLTHHVEGLRKNRAESLSKASEHYSISYARFLDCSASAVGRALPLPLGVLASVNNLSHLHSYCRNMEQVAMGVDELSQLLSSFLGQSPRMKNGCLLFVQNVCYFQASVFCSAPAA